jgi:E3 ubiquitin-protein ligase ATL10/75/76/77/78
VSGENCVICLCPVEFAERVRTLPSCNHRFHRCCVDQWLLRCASCPTCKAPVVVK